MTNPKVIIVVLRRPNHADPREMRTDPLWEFGSFGCTGCHKRNLMNPLNIDVLIGARLAFAQGGQSGFKLVLLTSLIEPMMHADFVEAKWATGNMPFLYSQAPTLIKNDGESDFPLLRQFIAPANCPSWVAKFFCKFRARKMPLDMVIAEEIIQVYDQKVASSHPDLFASTYVDALPYPPPLVDSNRQQTYHRLLGLLPKEDKA